MKKTCDIIEKRLAADNYTMAGVS